MVSRGTSRIGRKREVKGMAGSVSEAFRMHTSS
jgi:hypothetical protein